MIKQHSHKMCSPKPHCWEVLVHVKSRENLASITEQKKADVTLLANKGMNPLKEDIQ